MSNPGPANESLIDRWHRQLVVRGDLGPMWGWATAPLRWTWLLVRSLHRDRAFMQAAGMAYTSLIAVVPLLLLVFSTLDAVGLLENDRALVERMVFESFLGDIDEVREILLPGLVSVDLGTLGLVGVGGLMFIAWRLFEMVEDAYCTIFGVELDRPWYLRLLLFYVLVTAVPVAMVGGFLRTVHFAQGVGISVAPDIALALIQYSLLIAALKGFPSTQVRWGPAAAGATTTMVLLTGISGAFRLYLNVFAGGDPVRVIYGSLGALPVFLLWLYLAWVAILVGVEVAAVTQNYRSILEAELAAVYADLHGQRAPGVDAALLVVAKIAEHWDRGAGPAPTAWLARKAGTSERSLLPVMHALTGAGITIEAEEGWLLARPPDRIQVHDVVRAWRVHATPLFGASALLQTIRDELDAELDGTVADALARWREAGPVEVPRDATGDRPA